MPTDYTGSLEQALDTLDSRHEVLQSAYDQLKVKYDTLAADELEDDAEFQELSERAASMEQQIADLLEWVQNHQDGEEPPPTVDPPVLPTDVRPSWVDHDTLQIAWSYNSPSDDMPVSQFTVDLLGDGAPEVVHLGGPPIVNFARTFNIPSDVEVTGVQVRAWNTGAAGALQGGPIASATVPAPPAAPPPPTGDFGGYTRTVNGSALNVGSGQTVEDVLIQNYPGAVTAVTVGANGVLRNFKLDNVGQGVFGGGFFTVEYGVWDRWSQQANQQHGLYMRSGRGKFLIFLDPQDGSDGDTFELHGYGQAVAPNDMILEDVYSFSDNRILLGGTSQPVNNVRLARYRKDKAKCQFGYSGGVVNRKLEVVDCSFGLVQFDGAPGSWAGSVFSGRVGELTIAGGPSLSKAQFNDRYPGVDLSGLTVMGRAAYDAWAAATPPPAWVTEALAAVG